MVNPFRRRTPSLPPMSKAGAARVTEEILDLPRPSLLPCRCVPVPPIGSVRFGEAKFDQAIFPAQEVENRLQALEAHQAARIDELEARLAIAETELAYAARATTRSREVW